MRFPSTQIDSGSSSSTRPSLRSISACWGIDLRRPAIVRRIGRTSRVSMQPLRGIDRISLWDRSHAFGIGRKTGLKTRDLGTYLWYRSHPSGIGRTSLRSVAQPLVSVPELFLPKNDENDQFEARKFGRVISWVKIWEFPYIFYIGVASPLFNLPPNKGKEKIWLLWVY